MSNNPFIGIDDALKGFDFSPWGGIEGFLEASKATGGGSALKRLVPSLNKAIDMTGIAVSGLPFNIVNEGGDIVDTSTDWSNEIGGMSSPKRLLYLLATSLCGGCAYLIPQRTPRYIYDLQYVAPHTITPFITRGGLEYFDRATDLGTIERYKPKEIIYFWLPDSDVEIGPALNTPLAAAALAAELIFNMDNTMKKYGERGFVPITLLGSKGMPNSAEREKAEGFFNKLLRGGFNVLAKIINSDALQLIKVGAGLDELKGVYIEIKREAKEGIADAFGIPSALFMSDNAYASEFKIIRRQWFTNSKFVGVYQTIEEVLSEQLLKPYKLRFQFDLQSLDIFQEDEAARSTSLSGIVSAVTKDPQVAKFGMSILGYDLNEAQEEMLEEIITDKQNEPTPAASVIPGQSISEQDNTEKPEQGDNPPEEPEEPEEKTFLRPDDVEDLAKWLDRAKTWFRKGKGSAVDWENKHLPESVAAPIRLKLATAASELDIIKAFEIGDRMSDKSNDGLKALASAIDKLAGVTPPPANNGNGQIVIDTTGKQLQIAQNSNADVLAAIKALVEQGRVAPIVNVTVPKQDAPVVNVAVPKQDAPVVNVKAAEQPAPTILVNMPKMKRSKQKVTRDIKGAIEGSETIYEYDKE